MTVEMETGWGSCKPRIRSWIHQKLEAARRVPPLDPSEGAQPCRHLDLRLLVSEMNVILSCPRYVNFLGSPRKPTGCQSCRSNRIAVMLPPSTFSKGNFWQWRCLVNTTWVTLTKWPKLTLPIMSLTLLSQATIGSSCSLLLKLIEWDRVQIRSVSVSHSVVSDSLRPHGL